MSKLTSDIQANLDLFVAETKENQLANSTASSTDMNFDPKDIELIVEAFWDFERVWGAPESEKRAALRLQEAAGYETPFDGQRKCYETTTKMGH